MAKFQVFYQPASIMVKVADDPAADGPNVDEGVRQRAREKQSLAAHEAAKAELGPDVEIVSLVRL